MPNPILDLLGQETFLRLVQRYGGQTLRVPNQVSKELQSLLGPKDAERLCFHFGGQVIYIPKLATYLLDQRNLRIKHLRAQGATIRELALQFDLSERQIYKILKKQKP